MQKILIVEDEPFFAKIVSLKLIYAVSQSVLVAESAAQAEDLIAEHGKDIILALLDLNLPDAPNGEIVDCMLSHGIPSIVFTALLDDDMRETILAKNVIDYVLKDNPSSVDYLVSLVKRTINNRDITALVVDGSSTARKIYKKLLTNYQFTVLEACNGEEALEIIAQETTDTGTNISLILTGFSLSKMDGCELIREVRKSHPKDKMVIIGISAHDNKMLSAKFIKTGANDFLTKPFLPEELLCRVSQNMDIIEQLHDLEMLASYDFLTGLCNRRFFFDLAAPIFATAKRNGTDLALAMIDVDFFKKVNDTYGHDMGDEVLKAMGAALKSSLRATDVVARMGGEEFCLIAPGIEPASLPDFLNKIRETIAELSFTTDDGTDFAITASIGAVDYASDNLKEMITLADEMLYESKNNGRNRVTIANQPKLTAQTS